MIRTSSARTHGLAALAFVSASLAGMGRSVASPNELDRVAAPPRGTFEIGALLGLHGFAKTNELGRYEGSADSSGPRSAVAFGARAGYALGSRFALELETILSRTETRDRLTNLWIVGFRGHLVYTWFDGDGFSPFLLVGAGSLAGVSSDTARVKSDVDTLFEAGLGFHLPLAGPFGARMDTRLVLVPTTEGDFLTPELEGTVSGYLRFGSGVEATRSAPRAEARAEGRREESPTVVDRGKELEPPHAEPTAPTGERRVDARPRRPLCAGGDDAPGCPPRDSDGDSLPDEADACAHEAGPRETRGCAGPDADGDGIVDRMDACVDAREIWNRYKDRDGCPDQIPRELIRVAGAVVHFESGSSVIDQKYYALLDATAEMLLERPLLHLEISGFTDPRGSDAQGRELSWQRADAVRQYILHRGVESHRVTAVGYLSRSSEDAPELEERRDSRRIELSLW